MVDFTLAQTGAEVQATLNKDAPANPLQQKDYIDNGDATAEANAKAFTYSKAEIDSKDVTATNNAVATANAYTDQQVIEAGSYTQSIATKGEIQAINLKVYPGEFSQTASTSAPYNNAPAGTDALRDAVNGKIYTTSEVVSGAITAIDFAAGTATVGGVSITLAERVDVSSSNISTYTDLVFDSVADMQSDTGLQGRQDGILVKTKNPVVSRWTKFNSDPGAGFVKPGVGCFLQLIHEADTTPEAYDAVPDDPNGDYTAEVQAWVDGCVANGFLSINTKKRFTVDSIVINADLDGIYVEYANFYSVENRAASNTPLILVDGQTGDIEKFSAGTLILEGRAQWTGDVTADQAANAISLHNGPGISLVGKPGSRIKKARIDSVNAKQLGNSAVNCASPDICSVGYIYAENVIEHPFGASVTQFGAISTWPSDFKPLYTVERIDCLNCGTIFDFSTVGDSKTDDSGIIRPKGYVGEGFGRNLVQRTKVHGNWDFECGLVDARNDSYDVGEWPVISFPSTVYERLRIGKIRGQKLSGGWRFEDSTVIKQGASIDEVDLTDCLSAGLRGPERLTIGSITQNGCGAGISSTFDSMIVSGKWIIKDVDRDYWVNNAPVSWGAVQTGGFIAPSAMAELSVGRFEIDNFGSATNTERYLRLLQPATGMKVRAREVFATNPGLNPPDHVFFANGGGVVYDLGVVDEDAQTAAIRFVRMTTGGSDNYLYLDRIETVSGIQDEFSGTLDQQGHNLWTWVEAGVVRFSTTKPVLKTDGSPI